MIIFPINYDNTKNYFIRFVTRILFFSFKTLKFNAIFFLTLKDNINFYISITKTLF